VSTIRDVLANEATGWTADEHAAVEAMLDLIGRIDRDTPDPEAVQQLRAMFDAVPQLAGILCDLAQMNADRVIQTLAVRPTSREAVKRNVHSMRDAMGHKSVPEMERLLIDHLLLCWLRLQHIELAYTQAMAESITYERGVYWERRLTAAQRRYLRASESLARVRRLSRPAPFQVNIGAQQMNVAADR
jgi:hypothetical protein